MFTNKTKGGNNDYDSHDDRIQRPEGNRNHHNFFFLRANRALLTLTKKVATEKTPDPIPNQNDLHRNRMPAAGLCTELWC